MLVVILEGKEGNKPMGVTEKILPKPTVDKVYQGIWRALEGYKKKEREVTLQKEDNLSRTEEYHKTQPMPSNWASEIYMFICYPAMKIFLLDKRCRSEVWLIDMSGEVHTKVTLFKYQHKEQPDFKLGVQPKSQQDESSNSWFEVPPEYRQEESPEKSKIDVQMEVSLESKLHVTSDSQPEVSLQTHSKKDASCLRCHLRSQFDSAIVRYLIRLTKIKRQLVNAANFILLYEKTNNSLVYGNSGLDKVTKVIGTESNQLLIKLNESKLKVMTYCVFEVRSAYQQKEPPNSQFAIKEMREIIESLEFRLGVMSESLQKELSQIDVPPVSQPEVSLQLRQKLTSAIVKELTVYLEKLTRDKSRLVKTTNHAEKIFKEMKNQTKNSLGCELCVLHEVIEVLLDNSVQVNSSESNQLLNGLHESKLNITSVSQQGNVSTCSNCPISQFDVLTESLQEEVSPKSRMKALLERLQLQPKVSLHPLTVSSSWPGQPITFQGVLIHPFGAPFITAESQQNVSSEYLHKERPNLRLDISTQSQMKVSLQPSTITSSWPPRTFPGPRTELLQNPYGLPYVTGVPPEYRQKKQPNFRLKVPPESQMKELLESRLDVTPEYPQKEPPNSQLNILTDSQQEVLSDYQQGVLSDSQQEAYSTTRRRSIRQPAGSSIPLPARGLPDCHEEVLSDYQQEEPPHSQLAVPPEYRQKKLPNFQLEVPTEYSQNESPKSQLAVPYEYRQKKLTNSWLEEPSEYRQEVPFMSQMKESFESRLDVTSDSHQDVLPEYQQKGLTNSQIYVPPVSQPKVSVQFQSESHATKVHSQHRNPLFKLVADILDKVLEVFFNDSDLFNSSESNQLFFFP